MTKPVKPLQIEMKENGDMMVRWSNSPKTWNIIKVIDKEMQMYVIFCMSRAAA